MQTIRITLRDDEARRLRELASREYRSPRAQASLLIVDSLRRADPQGEPGQREPAPQPAEPSR